LIACQQDKAVLAELILSETTTLGLRFRPIHRYETQRDFRLAHTSYGDINVKLKIINGKVVEVMPEYDD
jgi:pyridinium-3,5-bisthiocarboxylic acid mononucleotide nickel chelatase